MGARSEGNCECDRIILKDMGRTVIQETPSALWGQGGMATSHQPSALPGYRPSSATCGGSTFPCTRHPLSQCSTPPFSGGVFLWWTRRESNPRPKIPTAGIYVCSRCLSVARAFPTDRGLEPSFVRFRLRYDALLRLADFRSFTPANHRLGFWRTSLAYAARASLLGLAVFVSPGFTRPPATSTRSLAFANPRRSRDAPKQAN